MSDARALEGIPLFRDLTEAQLRSVAAILRTARSGLGDAILVEGEPGRSLFVLVRGSVETTRSIWA